MDATAQSVPKGCKVSRAFKVSKAYKASKAHRASKALRDLQVLKGNRGAFYRRVTHRLVRQIARLAKTEDVRRATRMGRK